MYKTALILAAGEGKRLKSFIPKVMHKVCGQPLIEYVLDAVQVVSDDAPIAIVGNGKELIEEHLGDRVRYALQLERKGTAHAVLMAKELLEGKKGYVTVTAGDVPAITATTFEILLDYTIKNELSACVLTAIVPDATGYGRIVRDEFGQLCSIVEHRDATDEQRKIKEINTSIYCFDIESLFSALGKVKNDNEQGELYLTDTIAIMKAEGKAVGGVATFDAEEAEGINDRLQLCTTEKIMRRRINRKLMENGVTMIDPESTYIEKSVVIGKDTIVYPNNFISGKTVIGQSCVIYPNSRIDNAIIGDEVSIQSSVILSAQVGDKTTVGPFAYLRPNTKIGKKARIGDFVELKNANIGNASKVSHLAYVGDADIGESCNIGCGVVFVNYDGKNKFRTCVEDGAFIGSNSNLVAPLCIGKNAFIAAGSTVTQDVPEDALCIARERQVNKPEWVKQKREKNND